MEDINIEDFFEEGRRRGERYCEGDYEHLLFLIKARNEFIETVRKNESVKKAVVRNQSTVIKLISDAFEEEDVEGLGEAVMFATTIGYVLGKGGELLDDMLKHIGD